MHSTAQFRFLALFCWFTLYFDFQEDSDSDGVISRSLCTGDFVPIVTPVWLMKCD